MSNNEPQRCLRCKRLLVNEKVPVCARCFRRWRRVGKDIGTAAVAGLLTAAVTESLTNANSSNSDAVDTNIDECFTIESDDFYDE